MNRKFALAMLDEILERHSLMDVDEWSIYLSPFTEEFIVHYFNTTCAFPRRWMIILSKVWKGFERMEKRRMERLNAPVWNRIMKFVYNSEYDVDSHYDDCLTQDMLRKSWKYE